MNTRALRSFIKVYERKSISAAAKELHISPQGLSKVIKQLEYDLGADLFFRGIQGMEPTESGELFYARAQHICYLLEDIKKELDLLNKHTSALTVLVSYSATMVVPVEKILEFSIEHPLIHVQLKEYPDGFPFLESFQDEVDIGIVVGPKDLSNCNQELLYKGETVVVVPNSHRFADRSELSLFELEGEQIIQRPMSFDGDNLFYEQYQNIISPNVLYETDNHLSIHRLCKEKNVMALSVDFIERSICDPSLKVLKLKEKIPQDLYLVSRFRENQNRAVSLFLDYIKEKVIVV